MTSPIKRKLDSSEIPADNKIPKLSLSFGPSFRKKLKADDAIKAVKEFVQANKEKDVVSEYIKAGGSPKEIISLMKQFDGKKDLIVASTLLSALECIISKAVSDLLIIQDKVEEACEELIVSYQVTLQTMLSSTNSSSSHRKIILKLFTGMVNLSDGLAKKLLTLFPINLKTLKILTDTKSSAAANKVRKCFINFLMSFLAEDNTLLVSELLQKKGLLTSIIPGLMNDHPDVVLQVLSTLHMKIVENQRISKTLKLYTFNTPILCSLAKLYNYRVSKDDQCENYDLVVSVEQAVKDAVHGLLLVLCTSHKRGVLFKDRAIISGKSPNQLIFTLLENIETPWEDMLRTELVTEIVTVCPEFIKHVYNNVEQYVQPSVSENWVNVIKFVSQVIEKQEFMAKDFDEKQAMQFVTSVVFPPFVQKLLHDLDRVFIHPHPLIRYHVISLLTSILHEIKYLLKHCHGKSFHKSLEINIDNFLNKNLIPSTVLLEAWKRGVDLINEDDTENEETDHLEIPDLDNYILRLVNLLLMYGELSPLNFNLLRRNDEIDFTIAEVQNAELQLKIAHLVFLIFNPKPGQDKFSFMMKKLLECYIDEVHYHQDEVLQNIFLSTSFFDGFEEEIPIWLKCIKNVSTYSVNIISDLIVETLSELFKKHNKFMTDLTSLSFDDDTCISSTSVNILADEYGHLIDISDEFDPVVMSPVRLSPMVPGFLYVLKNNEKTKLKKHLKHVQPFVTSVLGHLLHMQSDCRGLEILINKYPSDYISSDIKSYIGYWNGNSSTCNYTSLGIDMVEYLNSGLSHTDSMEEIIRIINKSDEIEAVLLWNMCIFYAVQLHGKHNTEERTVEDLIYIFHLLSGKLKSQKTLCLRLMLTNRKFVNNFVLEEKKLKYNCVKVLLKTALDPINKTEFKACSKYLSSYRLRFILTILERLQSGCKLRISIEVDNLVKFLMLPSKTISGLLNKLNSLPINLLVNEKRRKGSHWLQLVSSLLNEAAKNYDEPLEQNTLNSFIIKVLEISQLDVPVEDFEKSLVAYLSAFPHHIFSINDDNLEQFSHQRNSILATFLMQYHPSAIRDVQSESPPVEETDEEQHHLKIQRLISQFNEILSSSGDTKTLCHDISSIADSVNDLRFLLEQSSWKEFVKLTLKFGLQSANSELIHVLRKVCAKTLRLEDAPPEEVSVLFQMTISHSEFVNIMLSDLKAKSELIELLLILAKANKSVMSSNHIPLLLGSYKATLGKCDQLIFQLLRFYENNGVRFTDCRPYLWGDAAVTHHSIRTEISVSLKRLPLPNQVLDLLDINMVNNTIRYFPLNRSLKPEGYTEYQQEMYDLSFMLPLMSHLLAPESKFSIQKFTRCGALPLVLCSLSSQETDVRMAGYHCLQRFRSHLFGREKEVQLWEHFVNVLRNGIISAGLNEENLPPRLACIVTLFLAQMSLIISEPLHPLFAPLTKFLLAKPSLDVNVIPDFLALFYSTDEKHKEQQHWILNVIKYGMRSPKDWSNAHRCFLFKLLLQHSFTTISNENTNSLVLHILKAGLLIPGCRQYLITKGGFLPWLSQIISTFSSEHRNLLPSLIEILALLTKTKNSTVLIHMTLKLLYKIPSLHVDNQRLEELLCIFSQMYTHCKIKRVIDEENIAKIINISEPLLSQSVKYRNCLKYRCDLVIDKSGKVDNYMIQIISRFLNKT